MAKTTAKTTAKSVKDGPTVSGEKVLVVGTTLATLGIALSLTDAGGLGGRLALLGLALSIYGLHRFGRSGPGVPAKSRLDS